MRRLRVDAGPNVSLARSEESRQRAPSRPTSCSHLARRSHSRPHRVLHVAGVEERPRHKSSRGQGVLPCSTVTLMWLVRVGGAEQLRVQRGRERSHARARQLPVYSVLAHPRCADASVRRPERRDARLTAIKRPCAGRDTVTKGTANRVDLHACASFDTPSARFALDCKRTKRKSRAEHQSHSESGARVARRPSHPMWARNYPPPPYSHWQAVGYVCGDPCM